VQAYSRAKCMRFHVLIAREAVGPVFRSESQSRESGVLVERGKARDNRDSHRYVTANV
jgi:hypothetical protein